MVQSGTVRLAPTTNMRLTWRTWPVRSASGPTMNPGVSHSDTTGRSWASHSCRNRAALSAPSASMAPPRWVGSLASDADRPPLDPGQGRDHAGPEPAPELEHGAGVGQHVDERPDVVGPQALLGHGGPQQALVGALPSGHRALEVGEVPAGQVDGLGVVGRHQVDHPVGHLDVEGPDLLGRGRCRVPRPRSWPGRPCRSRRPPVAMMTSQQPSRAAFPAKHRPEAMPTSGTRPLSRPNRANAWVSRPVMTA